MPELVINVTNIISPLCYTILKLEPYTVCPFKCIYCYSKWYIRNPTLFPFPRPKVVGIFKDFVRKTRRRGLKPIPFRLSTLIDPFPPVEQLYRITEKILRVALDYEYPIIINTKSIFYTHNPIKEFIVKLLDKDLVVIQISISVLNSKLSEILEPRAPPLNQRLNAIRDLGSTDIPLALRLSPYIPYMSPTNENEVKEFTYLCRDLGVKHVIVEGLRIEGNKLEDVVKVLGIQKIDVDKYNIREIKGMKPVVRVSTQFKENIYPLFTQELNKYRITFATCKEGLFRLHTSPDCCGAFLLKESYILRVTLYDIYRYSTENSQKISIPLSIDMLKNICLQYSRLCQDMLTAYPKVISKMLKYHEKKLLKVLQKIETLQHIAPHIIDKINA
ncbi:MAG: radical SAM protein [Ignisphaera sp.]|uniref:Radical SAM protein n=1 Tax=Ignisphaera aggregans TaxID=334771 RepID=A0A7C4JK94_9CREN